MNPNREDLLFQLALSKPAAKRAAWLDAEPLLRQGYEGLVQRQASLPPYLNAPRRIKESLERLVQLYDAWGKPTQANEWKQKLAAFQQANKVSDNKSKTQ